MSDNQEIFNISEIYGYNDKDLPDSAYPIRYHDIAKAQETDAKLTHNLVSHKDYTLDTFRGGDKDYRLIFRNNRIFLPAALQKKTVDWYHEMLFHPGETRTEHTNIVNNDPWSGILDATMFAVRATYHTTLHASLMQLVFVRDAILNIKHVADWEHIRQWKKLQINHNNMRENMWRNNHQYKVGDKILVKRKKILNAN